MNAVTKQKWYILNIVGPSEQQEARERIYLTAAKTLNLPIIVEYHAAPEGAIDARGEPFYGDSGNVFPSYWCLVWSSAKRPGNLVPFWNLVDQLQREG